MMTDPHPPEARTPAVHVLDPASNEGYLSRPIPVARDTEIRDLLAATSPQALAAVLDQSHAPVLLAFAERMAALAVRRHDPDVLRDGIRAAAAAFEVADEREALLVLPLLWRSAELLGLDPAAELTGPPSGTGAPGALADFATRQPEDRTIQVMGYRESADDDGFRYERTW
jgi:hypothetical protein